MNEKRSMSVTRMPGRTRVVSLRAKQVQWLQALFAYAELFNNAGLLVSPELERVRTVPAIRWRSHRLLLDAYAALLCRLTRAQVHALKKRAWATVRAEASFEAVESGLGEYQSLDVTRLVEQCPFFLGDTVPSTYWEGWATTPGADEEPAHTLSARLTRLTDRQPGKAAPNGRSVIVVVGHAVLDDSRAGRWQAEDEWRSRPLELCYSFWTERLPEVSADGSLGMTPAIAVDAIPLMAGRAAWAVGVRVVEGDEFEIEEAEQALGAAVELVAALAPGQRAPVAPAWELPVMFAARLAQESVAAVLETFVALGSAVYQARWQAPEPTSMFDSKYLYAVCPATAPRSLRLRAGRYETELEVAIGSEPLSMRSANPTRTDNQEGERERPSRPGRWSMLHFRGIKAHQKTGAD